MKRILISAFAASLSTFAIAEAAIVEFGARAAPHRMSIAQRNSLTSIGGALAISARLGKTAPSDVILERPAGLDACSLAGGPIAVCRHLVDADALNPMEFRSIRFVIGPQFDRTEFSFARERDFAGDSRHAAFYIDGARGSFRGLFAAMLGGVSSVTLVGGGTEPTEFDQNGDATIPLLASAPLILTGLAAFGVVARRRRMRAI